MPERKNYQKMIVINLHEINYIEDVLKLLTEEFAHETVVVDAEAIRSRHGDALPEIGLTMASFFNIFQKHSHLNQNYLITALLTETNAKNIAKRLAALKCEERYAVSFWFLPVDGYFYHKGDCEK